MTGSKTPGSAAPNGGLILRLQWQRVNEMRDIDELAPPVGDTMHTADQWDELVSEARREYPQFPRVTLERLVIRTAHELRDDHDLPRALRDAVMNQLRYVHQLLADPAPAARTC